MEIKRMTPYDIPGVHEVEKASFSKSWTQEMFIGELNNKCSVYFVAKDESQILAYAGIHISFDEADIINIAVLPKFRQHGIANKLLDKLVDECKKNGVLYLHLDVRESNTPAISLYEKNNFIKDGLRKHYYSDTNESAILMTKNI